jgi:hypothetical protein
MIILNFFLDSSMHSSTTTFKFFVVKINTKRNKARKKDAYQLVSINTGNNTSMLEIDFTRCFLKSIRKYITKGISAIPVILGCD